MQKSEIERDKQRGRPSTFNHPDENSFGKNDQEKNRGLLLYYPALTGRKKIYCVKAKTESLKNFRIFRFQQNSPPAFTKLENCSVCF